MERREAFFVRGVHVRAGSDQRLNGGKIADPCRLAKRRVGGEAITSDSVHVRARVDQGLNRSDIVEEGSFLQRCRATRTMSVGSIVSVGISARFGKELYESARPTPPNPSTVSPAVDLALTSAPAAISAATTSRLACPTEPIMSGVTPSLLRASTLAPDAIRSLTTSRLPPAAASQSAVSPSESTAFTSTLRARSAFTAARSPAPASRHIPGGGPWPHPVKLPNAVIAPATASALRQKSSMDLKVSPCRPISPNS
jgi:hypothetical protein